MADLETENMQGIGSHTLAYLRSHERKLDLILETLGRQGDRLARLGRDVGERRRDTLEIKSDIALLENKVLSAQTQILSALLRLDDPDAVSAEASLNMAR